jgi:hypothetical protein
VTIPGRKFEDALLRAYRQHRAGWWFLELPVGNRRAGGGSPPRRRIDAVILPDANDAVSSDLADLQPFGRALHGADVEIVEAKREPTRPSSANCSAACRCSARSTRPTAGSRSPRLSAGLRTRRCAGTARSNASRSSNSILSGWKTTADDAPPTKHEVALVGFVGPARPSPAT